MAFIDDLAFIELLLVMAAAVLTYVGIVGWWNLRMNDAKALRSTLKGAAAPLGIVGSVAFVIGIAGELSWPFPASYHMAGYNIFFFDAIMLFSMVLIAYAVAVFAQLRFQYVGIFALVAGAAVAFYGWVGYTANPQFTKEPFETLLLYVGFGVAGIAAFPTSVILDYYLGAVDASKSIWGTTVGSRTPARSAMGARGVATIPGSDGDASETKESVPALSRVPYYVQLLVLAFPFFMALAGIAALLLFGSTLPGHLGSGPGGAP